jgi:hypothetical protein
MDEVVFQPELKINESKSYPTRSESIFALAEYLDSLRDCDKYQLFDLEPVNGGFSLKFRETKGKNDRKEFTHYNYVFISRNGAIVDIESEVIK